MPNHRCKVDTMVVIFGASAIQLRRKAEAKACSTSEHGNLTMIITHKNKTPLIDSSAYVAPNATLCGDVIVGAGARIMFGACLIAEGQTLEIGENCIVMENAVIRTTDV